MTETKEQFGVWCQRARSSVFGAAEAWMKVNGEVWLADTEAAAKAEADRLNTNRVSPHVGYSARRYR